MPVIFWGTECVYLCYKNYVRAALNLISYSIICMSIGANKLCLFSLKPVSLHIYKKHTCLCRSTVPFNMLTASIVQVLCPRVVKICL